MAAPLVQEQVVPEEVAPEQAVPEEVEMAEEEVLMEEPVLDEAMFMFGKSEKDLTEGEWAKLEEQRKQWDAEHRINQQKERGAQLAIQLQADEQRGADWLIQMGPARKTVAPPMEEEVEQAKQAFGDISLDATKPAALRQAFSVEIVTHSSDEDADEQRSVLLARQFSKQVASEAEADHE